MEDRQTPATRSIGPATALLLMPASFALLAATGWITLDWGVPGLVVTQVVGFALPAWIAARFGARSAAAAVHAPSMGPSGRPPPAARRVGRSAERLGLVWPSGRALAGGALLAASYWYVSAAFVLPLVDDLITEREARLLAEQFAGPEPLAVKLLAFAALPALCEEMLFRGAIARGLEPRLRLAGAALLSSLYFALLHGSLARLPITFALGIILAIGVLRSGSLVPALLIHAGNNAAAVLLTWPPLAGTAVILGEAAPLAIPLATLMSTLGVVLLWRAGRDRTPLVSDATSL